MINFERGKLLLKEAGEYYEEVLRAFERQSWNVVVRRAQEVVELSLKGLLKIMGIEFPKVRDVGTFFVQAVSEKGLTVERSLLEEIKRISARLSETRAPSFYMEEVYSEEEAQQAKNGAEKVWIFARGLAERLCKPEEKG